MRVVQCAILAILFITASLVAGNLQSLPERWLERVLPEKMPALKYPEYYNTLEKARAQVATGRYRQALSTLAELKGDLDPVAVALVKAEALSILGRTVEAGQCLDEPKIAGDLRVRLGQAKLLADAGQLPESMALLKQVVRDDPKSLKARFMLGDVAQQAGDIAAAKAAFDWFVAEPQSFLVKWQDGSGDVQSDAESATLIGRALDRWAQLNGEYKGNPSLNNTILNIFIKAYDVIDREYTPAHLAAAEYFLNHDNKEEGQAELAMVLEINPNDINALKMMAQIVAAARQAGPAEEIVATLRKINPESIAADLIEVRCLLLRRQYADANATAQRILQRQSKNIEALSLLATAQILALDEPGMGRTLARVDAIDPHNAGAYVEVADYLISHHQYGPAESLYQTAVQRAPWWNAARNGLGVLYTHTGEEDKARAVLDAAHEIDPFNLKTTNYLRVLDQMEKFKRTETAHFIFIYDAQDDPIVPVYFAPYMESAYQEVAKDFQHEPKQKTLLEVFPTAAAFSVRTAGMMGAETYGASFGPVITAVAPRAGQTLGKFNWARVLRHEFTHVINMSATGGRCPRWLTEGLAVWQEKVAYRFEWVPPVLYKAATKGELWKVRDLERSFASPKKGTDGEVAYMEGFWMVLFLREKYGPDSVIKLLNGYAQGQEDEAAFQSATGAALGDVEAAFFAWAKDRVAKWGYDKDSAEKFKTAYDEGEDRLKSSQFELAIESYTAASKLQPLNSLPHRRLAGLYLKLKQPKEALPQMEALIDVELQDNRYAKRIARAYKDAGDLAGAIKYGMIAVQIDPYDPLAHDLLGELYDATKNPAAQQEKDVAELLKKRK